MAATRRAPDRAEPTTGAADPPDATGARGGSADVPIDTLLPAAAAGDEAAWRAIVARYGRRVYALVRARCGDHHLAEEVTQSVFATLANKLGQYEERGKFEPWLFRVAANRMRDELRRRTRHATPTDPQSMSSVRLVGDDAAEDTDHRELAAVRDALGRLSEADRTVVELRHLSQMSFQQIADTLGQPIGTVLARHHRALKKLRSLIEDDQTVEPRPGAAKGEGYSP
ncbi:MAG: sigma-70 family RNA polymerase sigma factor [Planctomycetota bacterium]